MNLMPEICPIYMKQAHHYPEPNATNVNYKYIYPNIHHKQQQNKPINISITQMNHGSGPRSNEYSTHNVAS